MDLTLASPAQFVPRVGPVMAAKLEKLGIHTVEDLLLYPPFRYNDFSKVSPISRVHPGDTVTISGEITSIVNLATKTGKRMQVATITDISGKLEIIWFNQPYLLSIIRKGIHLNLAGTVQFFGKKIAMMSPDYELAGASNESLNTGRLVPVYPETAGVSSKWLRSRIDYLLHAGLHHRSDFLPEHIKSSYELLELRDAISGMHFPDSPESARKSMYRLSFDELLMLQLYSQRLRITWENTKKSPRIKSTSSDDFFRTLPFELTDDQRHVIDEVTADFSKPYPMNRLLEGDVGSGKTVVAAAAMYQAHRSGYQSVLMAPTQILAQQHYQSIKDLFDPFHIDISLITGSNKIVERNTSVYIGTHALLSQNMTFDHVGLIVIDEQQRFGVAQRELIKKKGKSKTTPHLLTMTATPIPRTIALAVWGNLDLSIINQMPKGRQKVKTWVVPAQKRQPAYEWIKTQISQEHAQVFIVCPLIDESETLGSVKSVIKEFERLSMDIFPGLSLALLHGRLKGEEKTRILTEFKNHRIDILISTPVVEVGIDIPDATIMMIEDADRFGLSQLHQLRGRVGRRSQQSYCLLFTDVTDEKSLKRLKAMESIYSGPALAEVDLEIRGPGELFGTRQHGLPSLRYADILDYDLVAKTRAVATAILSGDPLLVNSPLLRDELKKSKIHAVSQN